MPLDRPEDSGTVILTAAAAARVQTLRELEGNPALHLRVSVLGGGCSGFQYKIDFDDAVQCDDRVFETDGVKLLVDDTSMEFMIGAEVDFVDELIGAAFKINNPNATASCGCGTSFSVF